VINLESTDSLTLGTSAVGAISAHVSWVDQFGTTFTPGRTNTASITTIATTTILAAPAASTQRNAKFISLFNTHASVTNTLTLKHTDGSILITLLTITLAAGESVSWTEGRGWTRFNSNGSPVILGNTGPVDVQTFSTAGTNTWTKPTAFVPTQVLVKLWGPGGGGGGGGSVVFTTACKGGAGGGGGACAVKYFLASELSSTEVVSIGSGGSSGIGNLSAAGSNGGNGTVSTFGALLSAFGGGGGTGGQIVANNTNGGGGGGTGGAAITTAPNVNPGGLPAVSYDGGGPAGANLAAISTTEFGGCSGISTNSNAFFTTPPNGSLFGGSGGGAAGYRNASGQAIGPNLTQGAAGRFPGGSGITGTVPTAGAAGGPANSIWGGSGGGAGGNSNNTAINGGAGGAGGQGGGGGGGGGLTIAGNTGGAGGAGGAGYCVVISW